MSAPFLIIDGYNLLHSAGLARIQYGPGDLQRARQRLLALLSEKLRHDERPRCTVVFDAQQAPGDLPKQANQHGITVQFALPGQDADTAIEQIIANHPASRRMIVVSGDHRLQQAAKRRNATPMDSDTFLRELDRRESISPHQETPVAVSPSKPKGNQPTKGSTQEWQEVFGAIDVSAIAEEVGREPLAGFAPPDSESARLDDLQRQLDDPDFLEHWLKDSPFRK